MDVWDREQLYAEVWAEPAIKVAAKYGISSVALGKVCRKLQIPVPGRGYWAKEQNGQTVKQIPLPPAKNLPIVHRMSEARASLSRKKLAQQVDPSDSEMVFITAIEARHIEYPSAAAEHKLVTAAAAKLSRLKPDEKGLVHAPYDQKCLDVCVAPSSIPRALGVLDVIIKALEAEGFPVSIETAKRGTSAQIWGRKVVFFVTEKTKESGRREVQEYSWKKTVIDYVPTGQVVFHVGEHRYTSSRSLRDGKKRSLEQQIPICVGMLLREARDLRLAEERQKQWEKEERERASARMELGRQIAEEEKKVRDLDGWVTNWQRAREMREFIAALEDLWKREGDDLSLESQKGQRIAWMKQQADRLDPMIDGPPSVLDRKHDIN